MIFAAIGMDLWYPADPRYWESAPIYGAGLVVVFMAALMYTDVKGAERRKELRENRLNEFEAFAYAVWMVGNMDTDEDKRAWWSDFKQLWERAGERVEQMHKRGIEVTQGFEATGIKL